MIKLIKDLFTILRVIYRLASGVEHDFRVDQDCPNRQITIDRATAAQGLMKKLHVLINLLLAADQIKPNAQGNRNMKIATTIRQ